MTIAVTTDTTTVSSNTIKKFYLTDNVTASTTWVCPDGITSIQYLVVAGGGGGGIYDDTDPYVNSGARGGSGVVILRYVEQSMIRSGYEWL